MNRNLFSFVFCGLALLVTGCSSLPERNPASITLLKENESYYIPAYDRTVVCIEKPKDDQSVFRAVQWKNKKIDILIPNQKFSLDYHNLLCTTEEFKGIRLEVFCSTFTATEAKVDASDIDQETFLVKPEALQRICNGKKTDRYKVIAE